jgi:hypothetical protein
MKLRLLAIFLALGVLAYAQVPSAFPYSKPVPNDTSTGTTQFTLTKINSSGNAVIMATTDVNGYSGIAASNAGTKGSVWIAFAGLAPLIMDGTATAQHYVTISSTTGGYGHDTGATTYPTSGEVIARVQTGCTGSACVAMVDAFGPESVAAGGGGGGGSSAFSALTSGTNGTAAMSIGTGASLAPTGSGTVSANLVNGATVPASAVILGTNSSGQPAAASTTGSGTTAVLANTPTLITPVIGAATGTSLLATGIVDGQAPVTLTVATTATLGGTYKSGYTINQYATAATGVTYTLPTAAAGLQYCIGNGHGAGGANTGPVVLATNASGQYIIFTDGTLSASGGNVTSGGAAGDFGCVFGVDATHWYWRPGQGIWTKN